MDTRSDSEILEGKLPCPNKQCASSDAYYIYTDHAYCFSCKNYWPPEEVPELKGMSTATKDVNSNSDDKDSNVRGLYEHKEMKQILEYPHKGFQSRKIPTHVNEFYDVRCSYNADGEMDAHYYPYGEGNNITGYKIRRLLNPKKPGKDFSSIGKLKGLFGQGKFGKGGKRIIITEGEIDCLSVAKASHDHYNTWYPVVSLPNGVSSDKAIVDARDFLRSFDEIILWYDKDKEGQGQQAAKTHARVLGVDKCKIVNVAEKDANIVLIEHGGASIMRAVWDAEQWSPEGILTKEDLWQELVTHNEKESIPYPACVNQLNAKLKGRRVGEITLWASGCLGYDTPVLMSDGSIKMSQDIVVNDVLMGDDGTPRNVLQLCRGEEQMYRVTISNGESFICNSSHILTVVNNDHEGRWGLLKDEVIDVKLTDYLQWSNKRKHLSKAFKANRLEFGEDKEFVIPPYLLGAWLGDGFSAAGRLSCHEDELIDAIADDLGPIFRAEATPNQYAIPGLTKELSKLNLINNKHIPEEYLTSSTPQRLSLLAGLLDTDGHYDADRNIFEFSQKKEQLLDAVNRLATSLGFWTKKNKQKQNRFGECFRLWISGEGLEDIPTKLKRKQARTRLQKKNALRSVMEIEKLNVDNYYGFTLDGNHRFVLGNGIVTHNTGAGKSTIVREIIIHTRETTEDKIGIIALEEGPGETAKHLCAVAMSKNPSEEVITPAELEPVFNHLFKDDRIRVLNHYESEGTLLDTMEHMALLGCKWIVLDHLTLLASETHTGGSENANVDSIMNRMRRLVKQHDVHIDVISQLRKMGESGKSFEDGVLPSLDDIKGSGAIKQVSFNVIGFARNLNAEDELDRNTINLSVLKCRHTGITGPCAPVFYSRKTNRICQQPPAGEYQQETFELE